MANIDQTPETQDAVDRVDPRTLVSVGLPYRLAQKIAKLDPRINLSHDDAPEHLGRAMSEIVENALDRKPRPAAESFTPKGMAHGDFKHGLEFCTGGGRWRVTDVGHRTVVAIKLEAIYVSSSEGSKPVELTYQQADKRGWYSGPPYAVSEVVFSEDDFSGCSPA